MTPPNKKPTILHVCMSEDLGGIETMFLEYTKIFLDFGYEVINIVRTDHPLDLNTFPNHPNLHWIQDTFFRKYRPYYQLHKLFKYKYLRGRNNILITHSRDCYYFKYFIPLKKHIQLIHNHRGLSRKSKNADALFVISNYIIDRIKNETNFTGKIYKTPNFINTPNATSPRLKRDKNTPITLGFLGRFANDKGGDIMLEKFGNLPSKYQSQIQIFMAGDGPDKKQYENIIEKHKIQKNIDFLGWVHDKDDFFSKIDALILPSRYESFGVVILEALARGIPVFANNIGGPKEILSDAFPELLFNNDQLAAFFKDLVDGKKDYLLSQPEKYRTFFEQNYSQATVQKTIKDALNDLLSDYYKQTS